MGKFRVVHLNIYSRRYVYKLQVEELQGYDQCPFSNPLNFGYKLDLGSVGECFLAQCTLITF